MPTDLPKRDATRIAWFRQSWRNEGNWAVAALSIPTLLLVLMNALPSPLVLPVFSIITVSWGLLMALRSYLRPPLSLASRERAQAMAGMLFLLGFGASMMTNVGDSLSALAELEKVYAAAR